MDFDKKKKVIIYELNSNRDVLFYGFLHGFSVDSEESCSGECVATLTYPVGIVEDLKGELYSIYVPRIKIENRSDVDLALSGELSNWDTG